MSTDPATLRAARLLLQQLGLTIDDLRWTPVAVPTIAEYLPAVIAAAGAGARRTYGTYWSRILTTFGDRPLDQVAPSEIEGLMRQVMAVQVVRRNTQGGVCAGEHLLAAIRAIYSQAVADQLIPLNHNPAARVAKPRRPPTNRRALTGPELAAITTLSPPAATTSHSTPCSFACTWRPPAAAEPRSASARTTLTNAGAN